MKKLILSITVLLAVLLAGCDNNKGPFQTRQENGQVILYSKKKPAKGNVSTSVVNNSGNTIIVSEVYYDKGIPAGNFILRDLNGYVIADAKGKWTKRNTFEGAITGVVFGVKTESKGTYSIDANYLTSYEGVNYGFDVSELIINGMFKSYYDGGKLLKHDAVMKDGKPVKYNTYFKEGGLEEEFTSKDGVVTSNIYFDNRNLRCGTISKNNILVEETSYNQAGYIEMHFKKTGENKSEKYHYGEKGNITKQILIDSECIEDTEFYSNGTKKKFEIHNLSNSTNKMKVRKGWDEKGMLIYMEKRQISISYIEELFVENREIRYSYQSKEKEISIMYNKEYKEIFHYIMDESITEDEDIVDTVDPDAFLVVSFLIKEAARQYQEKMKERE